MSARRSWRMCASMVSVALVVTALAMPARAQDPIAAQVVINAIGADGVSGLALLAPAADGGTSIQIIVARAPDDTFAVIHGGDCEAIDPTPVALLGDVSATSQVTVTNRFAALADGGHVLALHAGLDLTTAIGCGPIPLAEGQPPAPTEQPSTGGGEFTGQVTGFSIVWPAGWERYQVVEVEGEDRVGLQKGGSSILVAVSRRPGADAQACVRDARQTLFDRLDQGGLRDLAPMDDAAGNPISGVETDRAWLAYRYTSVEDTGEFDVTDYLECRVSGDLLVSIAHRTSPVTYVDDAAERDALLASLVLPTGSRAPTTEPGGGSYTAPTVGFTLTWDGRWSEYPAPGLEAYEHVGLSDGPSRVAVSGIIDPATDALACAQDSDADFQVRASDGRIADLQPLTNADGSRVRGGDASRAWVGYRYTDPASGDMVVEYHECRAANSVVVRIQHRSLPEVYEQEAAARDALLQGLVLPASPPAPPSSTPNPDCEGYQSWHDATSARMDALTQLKADADEAAMAYDLPRYVAVLVRSTRDLQRMRSEQETGPVPPLARAANDLAVKTFEAYASASRILTEYYQSSTTTATLQRASRAQKAAEREEAQFNVALADVEAGCG